jgi:hypothetical protein
MAYSVVRQDRQSRGPTLKTAAEFIGRVLAGRQGAKALNLSAIIAGDRIVLAWREHRYADALTRAHRSAEQLEAFLRLVDASQTDRAQVSQRSGNIAPEQMNMRLYEEAIPNARREVETPDQALGLPRSSYALRSLGCPPEARLRITFLSRCFFHLKYASGCATRQRRRIRRFPGVDARCGFAQLPTRTKARRECWYHRASQDR